MKKPEKLYCYVDESGQDTKGALFVVAVVIVGTDKDQQVSFCEKTEKEVSKGFLKWIRTYPEKRLTYIRRILKEPLFKGRLYIGIHYDTKEYLVSTIGTIAWAIQTHTQKAYKATVLIDGLPRSQQGNVTLLLRKSGISTEKVRGIKQEGYDALILLADALGGLVRASVQQETEMMTLFEQGKRHGYIIEQ